MKEDDKRSAEIVLMLVVSNYFKLYVVVFFEICCITTYMYALCSRGYRSHVIQLYSFLCEFVMTSFPS